MRFAAIGNGYSGDTEDRKEAEAWVLRNENGRLFMEIGHWQAADPDHTAGIVYTYPADEIMVALIDAAISLDSYDYSYGGGGGHDEALYIAGLLGFDGNSDEAVEWLRMKRGPLESKATDDLDCRLKRSAQEFAEALNLATPEDIAAAMETMPTDVLEWGVRFEALFHRAEQFPPQAAPIERSSMTETAEEQQTQTDPAPRIDQRVRRMAGVQAEMKESSHGR